MFEIKNKVGTKNEISDQTMNETVVHSHKLVIERVKKKQNVTVDVKLTISKVGNLIKLFIYCQSTSELRINREIILKRMKMTFVAHLCLCSEVHIINFQ